jgi:hypothetical protein
MLNEQQKITRLQFRQLLSKAWERLSATGNGVSAFRATVIHPFDPSAIPEHAFTILKDMLTMKPDKFSWKQTLPSQSQSGMSFRLQTKVLG